MNKLILQFFFIACLLATACSDKESSLSTTYKGYFTDSEGGMIYDFFQETDTTVLVLNASNIPCEYTETIEEVPCGDTPIYLGKTYILTLSDTHATLTIGTASHKYDYVADKRTRTWSYHSGEYSINLQGYEQYKKMANVHRAIVYQNHVNLKKYIAFFRRNGNKEELAFVSNGNFVHKEYGPKRMHKVDLPSSVEEYSLVVMKKDEYTWILTGEEITFCFHVQDHLLIQTKPVYKYIGKLS